MYLWQCNYRITYQSKYVNTFHLEFQGMVMSRIESDNHVKWNDEWITMENFVKQNALRFH